MAEPDYNLNYEIVGKRQAVADSNDPTLDDHYDVVWTHKHGLPPDELQGPAGLVKTPRSQIKDLVVVPAKTELARVVDILEAKRPALAKSLGVSE